MIPLHYGPSFQKHFIYQFNVIFHTKKKKKKKKDTCTSQFSISLCTRDRKILISWDFIFITSGGESNALYKIIICLFYELRFYFSMRMFVDP